MKRNARFAIIAALTGITLLCAIKPEAGSDALMRFWR